MTRPVGHAGRSDRRWIVLAPIIGGTCLVLIAIVLIAILAVRNLSGRSGEQEPGIPLRVTRTTATPCPATPVATPGAAQICDTIVSSGDIEQPVPLPVTLTVAEQAFPMVITVPSAGVWSFPEGYPGAAAWVCGTVVNYLVQLEATPANQALLEGLTPGTALALRLSNGTNLLFHLAERRQVSAYDPDTLAQVHPGLTLIYPLNGDTWQVITSDYAAETETAPVNTLAQPNQAVQVGNVQVTVERGHVVREGMALQPGTMAYVVEYSLVNTGSEPLNTVNCVVKLQDGSGNWYLCSPEASAIGDYGPLGGQIAPGTTVQASAGYIVPETLTGPTVIWTFAPDATTQLQASVGIAYESSTTPAADGQFAAAVTDAFLSSDGQTVVIEAEIQNTGDTAVTVALQQISLTSSAGLSVLRMAAPPLPWVIAPGQTQVVELQYARPNASAALLTLGGYSFEIQGLQ